MTDKNLLVITPHRKEPGKQRIAAYCRVSSRSDEQLNSLTNQINFYRSLFENDDTVVFVGIYAEEGLSGTQGIYRTSRHRMSGIRLQGNCSAEYAVSLTAIIIIRPPISSPLPHTDV